MSYIPCKVPRVPDGTKSPYATLRHARPTCPCPSVATLLVPSDTPIFSWHEFGSRARSRARRAELEPEQPESGPCAGVAAAVPVRQLRPPGGRCFGRALTSRKEALHNSKRSVFPHLSRRPPPPPTPAQTKNSTVQTIFKLKIFFFSHVKKWSRTILYKSCTMLCVRTFSYTFVQKACTHVCT